MGQKTNPIGNRLGIIRGWESNWYGGKDFAKKVVEDEKNQKLPYCQDTKRGYRQNHYRKNP
jgi:small subunit ribosomal protein S3